MSRTFEPVVMPFDKIIDAVQKEMVEAGLLIHEGQLFFPAVGFTPGTRPGYLVARTDGIATPTR